MIPQGQHIAAIDVIAKGLQSLLSEVAFVGGATIVFYVDKEDENHQLRPTEDVDCVIEAVSRIEYNQIEEQLRNLGFQHCIEKGSPVCRFSYKEIKIDVMPTEGKVLGFNNKWYKPGIQNSIETELPSGRIIKIFSLPYFLATKLEAFLDRGNQDYYGSKDMEDLITVFGARKNIRSDIFNSPDEIKSFLKENFENLCEDENFIQCISGHLNSYHNSEERAANVLDIIRNL